MPKSQCNKVQVLGIDPGLAGAICLTDGRRAKFWFLPLVVEGKDRSISYRSLKPLLNKLAHDHAENGLHVFLERAVPFAMGSKGAFNYGRGFEAVTIALSEAGLTVTLIEPQKWAKEMHEGISNDLTPKVRSGIALKRLYPHLVGQVPVKPKGGFQEGPMDALLIAGYGLRRLSGQVGLKSNGDTNVKDEIPDFF